MDHPIAQEQKDFVMAKYNLGASVKEMAECGLTQKQVYRVLRTAGLRLSKSKRKRLKAKPAHTVKDKPTTSGEIQTLGIKYGKNTVTLRVTKTFAIEVSHE
jgi:hypothetical protein